jgi:hypothetical protein
LPEVNFYSFDMQCINFCVTLVKFLFVIPSCIKGGVDMAVMPTFLCLRLRGYGSDAIPSYVLSYNSAL